MGTLASGDALVAAPMMLDQDEVAEIQRELLDQARADLAASLAASRSRAPRRAASWSPPSRSTRWRRRSRRSSAAEVIVLTRPHVVAEFFHLDWTSRARRKLGVPVLHLLEHENFDEQAGGPRASPASEAQPVAGRPPASTSPASWALALGSHATCPPRRAAASQPAPRGPARGPLSRTAPRPSVSRPGWAGEAGGSPGQRQPVSLRLSHRHPRATRALAAEAPTHGRAPPAPRGAA